MVRIASAAAAAALVVVASSAEAAIPATEKPREYEVGAGLLLNLGGAFLQEASSEQVELDGVPTGVDYNGFAGGPSFGFGLAAEFRWKGYLGLEIDLIKTTDESESEILNETVLLEQSAIHLPVLLKGTIPAGIVRPQLILGFDFVFPSSPKASLPTPIQACQVGADGQCSGPTFEVNVDAHADSYTMWVAGLGFEFALPIEDLDLRLPLSFRAEGNLDSSDDVNDRATVTNEGGNFTVDFLSEYQWHAEVTVGLMYHFL